MIFKIENKHINCKKTLFIRLIPDCVARDVVGVYVDVEEVEVGDGVDVAVGGAGQAIVGGKQ